MNIVYTRDLKIDTVIGVNDWEREASINRSSGNMGATCPGSTGGPKGANSPSRNGEYSASAWFCRSTIVLTSSTCG